MCGGGGGEGKRPLKEMFLLFKKLSDVIRSFGVHFSVKGNKVSANMTLKLNMMLTLLQTLYFKY